MSIQALPTQRNIPLTLKATQFYGFATPAITVPFPSAYAQTQIPFAYKAVPTYAATRVLSTIGGVPATAGISATTNSIAPGATNYGQSPTGPGVAAGSSGGQASARLPVWAIGAIAGGGGAVVLALLVGLFCCCTRRSAREKRRLKKARAMPSNYEDEKEKDFNDAFLNRSNSKKSKAPDGTRSTYFGVSGVSPLAPQLRNSALGIREEQRNVEGRFKPQPIHYGQVDTEEPIFFPRAPMPIREERASLELGSVRTRSSGHEMGEGSGMDSPRRSWGTGNESDRDLLRREAAEHYPLPKSNTNHRPLKATSSPSRLSKSTTGPLSSQRYDSSDLYGDANNPLHPPSRQVNARSNPAQHQNQSPSPSPRGESRRVGGPREMRKSNASTSKPEGYFNYEEGDGKGLGSSAM